MLTQRLPHQQRPPYAEFGPRLSGIDFTADAACNTGIHRP
jgi:hypothetical protein